ncbi:212_t:CDS:2, partial [Funneliformis caledonium]
MKHSKHAVVSDDGELDISLYNGQPLVYTFINDHKSRTNLLAIYPDNININKVLKPSDICILFPVAEITYNAESLKSFLSFMYDDDEKLHEMYGHLFSRKVLVGGKLFIDDFESDSTQIDAYKSHLTWAYDSAKYNKENSFITIDFFPKIRTSDGKELNTLDKLAVWMDDLYQKNVVDIISYNSLIPISDLRSNKSLEDTLVDKQPEIANFKEKLSLEEWIEDSIKRIAINLIKFPFVYASGNAYSDLELIKPKTNLEEFLLSNNIYSANNLGFFPFMKSCIESDDLSYLGYTHLLVKCEKYRILLNEDDIKPSEEFKQAIETALDDMKPFASLKDVFDEYGHFIPLNIVLGKSLKNILPNTASPEISEQVDLGSLEFGSLKSHLDKIKFSYLLTQKGNVIKKDELSNWIQNTNNYLEIIEYDKIISLYKILGEDQRNKIDVILNEQDNFKIIMTGIVDLKDLNINNTEHYKRINIEPSLEDENFQVFGSIMFNNGLKSEIFVSFGLCDFNGFSVMIRTLKDQNIKITECSILWMIIGKPSKLSVFSPKNRELQLVYFTKSITLQPDLYYYSVETSNQLSRGYTVFVNAYLSTKYYEPINIKLDKWSKNYIYFQIYTNTNLNHSSLDDADCMDSLTNIDVQICILSSDYKTLNLDIGGKDCCLDLIGYTLNERNFNKKIVKEQLDLKDNYYDEDAEEWFDTKEITLYDHTDFKYVTEIGSGSTASVFTVNWKNEVFAIKKFHKNLNMKEIINESKLLKEQTIYFLGVLFWELTSRSPPFDTEEITLIDIFNGKREKPILNTNSTFVELYEKCWQLEPVERPNIRQVILELNNIREDDNIKSTWMSLKGRKNSIRSGWMSLKVRKNSLSSNNIDSKYPRIKISFNDSDDLVMDVDSSSLPSLSPFPSPLPSSCPSPSTSMDYSQETIFQYENE